MRLRVSHLVLFSLVVIALLSSTLLAQSFTPVRELKNLSPSALARLHTLETLNALPAGQWHFHVGDIPHGESPSLDDSAWPLVEPASKGHPSKAPKDAVWYRRTIEVPRTLNGYDITGARVWFQFRADANGPMPQIIYFNGKRVALGDDLEPIVLFEPAKPGDKILVAVKLLHTVDDKTFEGIGLRVDPLDTALSDGRPARPSPDDLRMECIAAANLLPTLPTPRKDLLPTVEEAIAAIDLNALAAGNQQAFDNSLRKAEFILSPLRSILKQDKIDLAGNSHIDAAWLWPRSETIDVVKRTFTTALQLMNEYPDYTFTQSAAQYSEWIADKYPDLNAQIKQRIKEGRWEIVGGMWVEPDLNIPDGESLVRQLLIGQRFFQKEYGVTARIGWNPDSFGYNWQLPQIYKRSGLDYFVTQKMHWNDTNTLPFRLFWWQSPDGSKVLTYFPTDYAWDNVNPSRLAADMAESQQRNPGLTEHLDLYGIGDHGGGPTRAMLDQADHWIALSNAADTPALKSVISTEGAPLRRSGETPVFGTTSALKGTGLSPSVSTPTKPGALAPQGTDAQAAIPTIRYGTAQHFFDNVQPHLNSTSPTWDYDTIAKGYTAPPSSPATDQVPQGFSLGSHSGDKNEGVLTPGLIGIPTWNDELYFEYHRGIFTSQAAHKRNIRTSETATLNAEKLASLAWLDGAAYPNDTLTENWKKITFNQFHDLAAGSGIAVIYRDAHKDFTELFNADKQIDSTSLNTIDAQIDTFVQPGVPIVVYNTLAWLRRSELIPLHVELPDATNALTITDAKGLDIPTQVINHTAGSNQFELLANVANIPALGYTVLHAMAAKAGPSAPRRCCGLPSEVLEAHENAEAIDLVNGYLQLKISKQDGCIVSLKVWNWPIGNVKNEFLTPQACANQLQTYADKPKQYDAWNIDPGTLDGKMTPIDTVDSIKVLTDGPLRKTIEIKRTWQHSHFTQDISLDAGADFIRVDTTVDWREQHVLLKAAFPLAHAGPRATFEIPYGAIERATTRNNSWEKAQFEVPALRWADLGDEHQGVSILNDSKYGYDALGNTLRLTLLRSPTWPDPDADQGPQHFTYEIYPHTGPWQSAQTVHRGYELNTPLTAQQVFPHTGSLPPAHSFASIDEPNIILTAMKKAEDANALIFRFYEATGKSANTHLHIPPGALYAIETNLMETPIPSAQHLPLTNDTITLPTNPWEIRTLEVVYPNPSTHP